MNRSQFFLTTTYNVQLNEQDLGNEMDLGENQLECTMQLLSDKRRIYEKEIIA